MSAKDLTYRIVCATCELVLVEGDPGADISHGICGPCRDAVLKKYGLEPFPEEANSHPQLSEA